MTQPTTFNRRGALNAFAMALLCSALTLGSTVELFVIQWSLA